MATVTARSLPWYARPRVVHALRQARRYPLVPLAMLTFLLVIPAVLATQVAPYDPLKGSLAKRLKPPAWQQGGSIEHPLGTDKLGRDILSRIIYGARISLLVGVAGVLLSGTLGVLLGLLAGYYGRKVYEAIMRPADIQLAMPTVLLAIALVGVMGPNLRKLILVLGITRWGIYTRTIRGVVLSLQESQFVEAANALGAGDRRILVRHILRNVWTPTVVIGSEQVGFMIILESALSFLGLGAQPSTPTWGSMISDGRGYLATAWYVTTLPGLALIATVLAVNFFGDGLRDIPDPRLRL